jgi:hypothetical protein
MHTDRKPLTTAVLLVGSAIGLGGNSAAAAQEYDWEKAEREIKRVAPSAFAELPTEVVKKLEEQGCTIPQSDFVDGPHNIIEGEFARPGQKDWAALCSREGKSSIVLIWGGPSDCPDQFGELKDTIFLQGGTEGRVLFSRVIVAMSADDIRELHEAFGGPGLPPLEHQAIKDAYAGKASEVLYCYKGEWVYLTGAD